MPTRKFEATEGLLHDDIRKQAGRIEKSWLEAVMNSVDADATEVEIEINSTHSIIRDDGTGMSEADIDKYFRLFGYKDDDVEEKVYGKFRRGRGQIFNYGKNIWHTQDNILVVDLENEQAIVEKELDASSDDEGIIESDGDRFIVDAGSENDLVFNQQKANEYFDGTEVFVWHYDNLDDVSSKVTEFKKLIKYIPWMNDIEVQVNGSYVNYDIDPKFETDNAYYEFGGNSMFNNASVYNMGAFVDDMSVNSSTGDRVPVDGIVISKKALDLNNARTEIIEGDDVWETIVKEYAGNAIDFLIEYDDKSPTQSQWLLKQCEVREWLLDEIKDIPLIEDIKGEKLSLSDLSGSKFSFAPEGNAIAEEAMERKGVTMIKESYESAFSAINNIGKKKDYTDVVRDEFSYEMKEVSPDDLSKKRSKNFEKLKWLINEITHGEQIKPGYSNHYNVWKDTDGTVYVDKNYLNCKKNVFLTEVIDEVIKVLSHDGSTMKGFDKSFTYRRNYERNMNKVSSHRLRLLNGTWDSGQDRSFY